MMFNDRDTLEYNLFTVLCTNIVILTSYSLICLHKNQIQYSKWPILNKFVDLSGQIAKVCGLQAFLHKTIC